MPKDKPGTGGIGGKGHYQGRYGKDLERIEAKLDRILELLDPEPEKTEDEYPKIYIWPEDFYFCPTYPGNSFTAKPNEELW